MSDLLRALENSLNLEAPSEEVVHIRFTNGGTPIWVKLAEVKASNGACVTFKDVLDHANVDWTTMDIRVKSGDSSYEPITREDLGSRAVLANDRIVVAAPDTGADL